MFTSTKYIIPSLSALVPLATADFHIGLTRNTVCFPAPTVCDPTGALQIVPSNDFDKAYQLPNLVGGIDQYGAGTDSQLSGCGYTGVSIVNTEGEDGSGQFFGNLLGDAGQSIGDCYWSDNTSSGKNGMSFVDKIICYSDMCGKQGRYCTYQESSNIVDWYDYQEEYISFSL